jgi:hypothetical protein
MSRFRAALPGMAAAVPALFATVGVLAFAARELSGTTPLSNGPMRNVAEAAGAGQSSEVLRLLRAGDDPRRFWPVRPEVISASVTRPTGLEAAVWGGRNIVELLDQRGFIADDGTRTRLACLAQDVGKTEVAAYLTASGAPSCEPGAAFASVKDRSLQR